MKKNWNMKIFFFSAFHSILPHVQLLWELVLIGEVSKILLKMSVVKKV